MLVDLRMQLAKQPPAMSSPRWATGALIEPAAVMSLTWGRSKVRCRRGLRPIEHFAASCVVVLELEDGIDAPRLLHGTGIDLGANLVAHQLKDSPWPHPFLAVDAHTVVTGSADILRRLVARGGDGELADTSMEILLKKLSPACDLAVMVDLSAARAAKWRSPAAWLDVWPAENSRWHLLCETPSALGLSVQSGDLRRCELGLVCSGITMAESIPTDIEKFAHDAIAALPAHIAALANILPPKKFPGEAVDQYQRLLNDLASPPAARLIADTDRRYRVPGAVWLGCPGAFGLGGYRRSRTSPRLWAIG